MNAEWRPRTRSKSVIYFLGKVVWTDTRGADLREAVETGAILLGRLVITGEVEP
jgi:hypothetical protein